MINFWKNTYMAIGGMAAKKKAPSCMLIGYSVDMAIAYFAITRLMGYISGLLVTTIGHVKFPQAVRKVNIPAVINAF